MSSSEAVHKNEINWKEIFNLPVVLVNTIGVLLIIFAVKGFMIPNHFLDGGILGISLLLHELYHINLSVLLILGNLPLMAFAYYRISRTMGVHSMIAIVILAAGLVLIDVPVVTTDKILISVFGGSILGAGIGLIMRSGAAIDGMEVMLVLTRRKIGLSMSELIVFFNAILFLSVAVELGIESAMFSIITYFTAAKMIDYVIDGLEQFTSLTIISGESEKIKHLIVNDFQKGITVYKGERGFLPGKFEISADCDIIVTIVTRLELLHIKNSILQTDPLAFMYVSSIKETSGGVLKKMHKH